MKHFSPTYISFAFFFIWYRQSSAATRLPIPVATPVCRHSSLGPPQAAGLTPPRIVPCPLPAQQVPGVKGLTGYIEGRQLLVLRQDCVLPVSLGPWSDEAMAGAPRLVHCPVLPPSRPGVEPGRDFQVEPRGIRGRAEGQRDLFAHVQDGPIVPLHRPRSRKRRIARSAPRPDWVCTLPLAAPALFS